MKTYKLLPLLILISCGNPHLHNLDGIDGLGSTNVPFIATPDELELKGILLDDGLNLKTEEEAISELVDLKNLDIDKDWILKIEFEKGENFRFKQDKFPGKKGTCREDVKGGEQCKMEIEFHAKAPGLYADNLKFSYSRPDDPKKVRVKTYPLRGEKISKVIIGDKPSLNVTLKTISHKDRLDLGKSFVKEPISALLVVANEGNGPVKLEIAIDKNEDFIFRGNTYPGTSGTCKDVLPAGKDCLLDIEFIAKKIGLYQDKVILQYYTDGDIKKEKISFPLLGEKIAKKSHGPLIASEIFSSNIDFGKVKVGTEVKRQFEIQNLGQTSFSTKELMLTNSDVFKYTGKKYPGLNGTCGDIILPGSCLIEVTYTPLAVKKDAGQFSLVTSEGPRVDVQLSGEGDEDRKRCDSTNEYIVIPEKSYPATEVIFPYLKSHPSTTAKLVQLYGLEVNSYIKELDNYTVKDGMVYVTFKLPKLEGKIAKIKFGVHVLKVIRDSYKDTESLCISSKSVRKCSGHEFSLASWQKLKNSKFWNNHKTPVSDLYEKQFASGEKKCGPYNCMNLRTHYELSEIFELTDEEITAITEAGVFTLIFSDDTRMFKMPRIAIKTKTKEKCE